MGFFAFSLLRLNQKRGSRRCRMRCHQVSLEGIALSTHYQKSDVEASEYQMHAVLRRLLWIARSKAIFCMLIVLLPFLVNERLGDFFSAQKKSGDFRKIVRLEAQNVRLIILSWNAQIQRPQSWSPHRKRHLLSQHFCCLGAASSRAGEPLLASLWRALIFYFN